MKTTQLSAIPPGISGMGASASPKNFGKSSLYAPTIAICEDPGRSKNALGRTVPQWPRDMAVIAFPLWPLQLCQHL